MPHIRPVALLLIDFHVNCLTCGTEYIPTTRQEQVDNQLCSVLAANNWCCRECLDKSLQESTKEEAK